jgi:hypothetical protein
MKDQTDKSWKPECQRPVVCIFPGQTTTKEEALVWYTSKAIYIGHRE